MDSIGRFGSGSGSGSSSSAACPYLRHRSSTKRTFSAMANSGSPRDSSPDDALFVSQRNDHSYSDHATQRPRLALPSRPTVHYPGDGYDFRRPVMSNGGHGYAHGDRVAQVVDLTQESPDHTVPTTTAVNTTAGNRNSSRAQRLPRFTRDILDVPSESEDEGPSNEQPPELRNLHHNNHNFNPLGSLPNPPLHLPSHNNHSRFSGLRRPSSSNLMEDVQFLEQRPATRHIGRAAPSRSHTPAQRNLTPYPDIGDTIDLTRDDDEDEEVVHLESRTLPGGLNQERPDITAGIGTQSLADNFIGFPPFRDLMQQGSHRLLERLGVSRLGGYREQQGAYNHGRDPGVNNHRHSRAPQVARRTIQPPGLPAGLAGLMVTLDYDPPAFDLGYVGANPPAAPKYEPPEKAPDGFTRSPGEDDIVVCPNCGDELALGDGGPKEEIWVIRKCGHAYCGDCAQNRAKGKITKKGKAAVLGAPFFKQCVVDKCREPVTSKAWVHVFGS